MSVSSKNPFDGFGNTKRVESSEIVFDRFVKSMFSSVVSISVRFNKECHTNTHGKRIVV